MNKDRFFILHIRDAISLIKEYTKGISRKDLDHNSLLRDGIVHQIQVIGEAAKNLSTAFTNQYTSVPWSEIARMRDRIVHHYFDVDLDVVWGVVERDIDMVQAVVDLYLKQGVE